MALRNGTMSKGHPQNPRNYFLQQILFPAYNLPNRYRGRDIMLQGHFHILSMQPNDVRCSHIPGRGRISNYCSNIYENFLVKSLSFSGLPNRISTKSPSGSQSFPSPTEFISLTTKVHCKGFYFI